VRVPGDVHPANDTVRSSFTVVPRIPPGWTRKADLPTGPKNKNVKDGGCLAYSSDSSYSSNSIYAFKGNNRCEFYRFDIATNTWETKESIPAIGRTGKKKRVKKGATLATLGGKVYGAKSNNSLEFWLYNPSYRSYTSYPWTQLADVPTGMKNVKEGAGAVSVSLHDSTYIYFLKGSGTQEFYRYGIAANTWETRENVPLGTSNKTWKNGSCLAYDGANTIYALKGSYNEFFTYDIAGNVWATKKSLPLIGQGGKKKKVKDGAGLGKIGTLPFSPRKPVVSLFSETSDMSHIFALKGGNTRELWVYDPASDQWTQHEDMPLGAGKNVKGGGALCASEDALYAFKGNNTLEFYQYGLSACNSQPTAYSPNETSNFQLSTFNLKLAAIPNPFTGTTTISYTLPSSGNVSLKLYDVTGELVNTLASGYRNAGVSSFIVSRSSLSSGIYVLKLVTENSSFTEKLVIE
jgi:hypothetical protein